MQKNINDKKENNSLKINFLSGIRYENKKQPGELLNPINFFLWLVMSFKDIF